MNSKEIVRRTLDFDNPGRLAISFGDSDIVTTSFKVKTKQTDWKIITGEYWERIDEWGNTWGRLDPTSKGEVVRGALEGIEDFESYSFPDFSCFEDYSECVRICKENPDKWVLGNVPGFTFNIARKLTTLENYLMDLLLEPEKMLRLHDRIDVIIQNMICNYAKAGVDAIFFLEDWGTQTQTLISPALWREEFFPRTKKHCDLAQSLGIRVFMHSCGCIGAIIPGLMEAGIDVLQFDQPALHGIDSLASYQNTGKITFWCPVDIQKTLQTRDEEAIRSEARELVDKLWKGRGGFIGKIYGDHVSIGLERIWEEYAMDEFVKRGKREYYI
ncbi:MAG: uroporphyrinogen decarboxylase family protein [Firmicutes bacterium]|nr:uroporphyrinogen decarboxylase family protein [Bacillota bacterium]